MEIVQTDIGELFKDALARGRRLPKNAGEWAITEWLREGVEAQQGEALVIFEDKIVLSLIMEGPGALFRPRGRAAHGWRCDDP